MAEHDSTQDKTEEPSEHKLRKSREEGQVARSRDVATTMSLLVTLLLLKLAADHFFAGLRDSFAYAYIDFGSSEIGLDDLRPILLHNLLTFMVILLPLLVSPVLVVLAALIPGGWTFASKNFTPRLEKLDPIRGLKRMVSLQNWTELLKSLLKITVLVTVVVWQIAYAVPQLLALQRGAVHQAIAGAFTLTFNLALSLLLVFVLFSVIDIPLQRFLFRKQMRMTKQERKEEHKQHEGRPEVKARIKQLQRQLLQRQIKKVLRDADVVVVNPQHYAVALKYDPKKAQAPYVLAKGTDEIALYIRQMAQEYRLEVLELPPLARAIYYSTRVNQQIPTALYAAVAHVLSYVVQLKAWRAGRRRSRPRLAANLPIPDALANRG